MDTNTWTTEFRPPAFPGSLFLSFEGIEGAGKSTQIKALTEELESRGRRVLVLREPGGTVFGEKLRQAVLHTKDDLHPLAEAYLFASSRAQLINDVILPELSKPGTVIICDRYIDSSLVYQGVGRSLGMETILRAHSPFPLNLVPHLTFLLQMRPETSQVRQKMRNAPKDYFESQGPDFYQKLCEGYERITELFPERVKVIDAERPKAQVLSQILRQLEPILLDKGAPLS